MLETVDPIWRATYWLQLVVQGISDDEVPWYDLMTPLTVGTKGAILSLAKHLLAIWWWSMRVQGQEVCPPTPMVLNIGQFMTWEEAQGMVGIFPHLAESEKPHAVGDGNGQRGRCGKWEFPHWSGCSGRKPASNSPPPVPLCWELPPRGLFRKRERGTILHTITFLDDMSVCSMPGTNLYGRHGPPWRWSSTAIVTVMP